MMITRCPQCATAFRITQTQLEARDGHVRCGRCDALFDARAELKDEEASAGAPFAAVDVQVQPSAEAPVAISSKVEQGNKEPAAPAEAAVRSEEVPAAPAEAAVPSEEVPAASAEAAVPSEEVPAAQPIASEPAAELDFGPKARRSSRWWWPVSAVLFLALAAQVGFYFRGAIALLFPETKPYIYALCAEIGCEVPLPRRAELMSIETSDLQGDPINPGVMVLSATLRNRAAFPQAYPALELTLTNDRDQALARRVLQPVDYLRRDPEDGFAASSEQQIRVHVEAAALKATSYRLYLFFP